MGQNRIMEIHGYMSRNEEEKPATKTGRHIVHWWWSGAEKEKWKKATSTVQQQPSPSPPPPPQQYDDDEERVTKTKQDSSQLLQDCDDDGSHIGEPQLRDVTQDGVYRSERDHGFLLCCTTATVEVHSSRLHLQHSAVAMDGASRALPLAG